MIWDSRIWKEELARDLQAIRDRLQEFESSRVEGAFESASVALDKFAYTSAYIVRKLSEAHKLSDEFESILWPVLTHARLDTKRPIHFMNWHRLEQHYDFEACMSTKITSRRLCNLLIHSFVFMPEMDETAERFSAILFNSDRTKDSELFEISLETLFQFAEAACEDYTDSFDFSVSGGVVRKSRDGYKS